jgi:hypothetical protein
MQLKLIVLLIKPWIQLVIREKKNCEQTLDS